MVDNDGRSAAALQADTALAAKVVAAIPELEEHYRLAEGHLSQRLMAEIKASMRKQVTQLFSPTFQKLWPYF